MLKWLPRTGKPVLRRLLGQRYFRLTIIKHKSKSVSWILRIERHVDSTGL